MKDMAAWLAQAGWQQSTKVGAQVFDTGLVTVELHAHAPWDVAVRVEATWTSPDGQAPLRRSWCGVGRPFGQVSAASLKAVREFLQEQRDE